MSTGPQPPYMTFNGGQLPMPVKTIEYPTPEERQLLQTIDPNWKDGDPVHAELGEALRQVAQEVAAADAEYMPVSPGTPPVKIGPVVPLDQLPPERRAEVLQTLRGLQEIARNAPPPPAIPIPGAAPELNQAILEAQEIAARQARVRAAIGQAMQETPVAPVQVAAQPVAQPVAQPPQPVAQPTAPVAQPAAQPATPPAPDTAPPVIAGNTNAAQMLRCHHCGWDTSKLSIAAPTDADKRVFLASMLGTSKRFWKDIPLFGGAVIVRFQSRLTLETEAASMQLRADILNGMEMVEMPVRMIQYEMCSSLASLTLVHPDAPPQHVAPPHAALSLTVVRKDAPVTNLPEMLNYLHTTVLPTDALRKAVGRAFMDFRELVAKLEANAANPDFYNGIAPAI